MNMSAETFELLRLIGIAFGLLATILVLTAWAESRHDRKRSAASMVDSKTRSRAVSRLSKTQGTHRHEQAALSDVPRAVQPNDQGTPAAIARARLMRELRGR